MKKNELMELCLEQQKEINRLRKIEIDYQPISIPWEPYFNKWIADFWDRCGAVPDKVFVYSSEYGNTKIIPLDERHIDKAIAHLQALKASQDVKKIVKENTK